MDFEIQNLMYFCFAKKLSCVDFILMEKALWTVALVLKMRRRD